MTRSPSLASRGAIARPMPKVVPLIRWVRIMPANRRRRRR
jgi:hypothetical protein